MILLYCVFFFFSSRRRHTRCLSDWSSDVCSSDLTPGDGIQGGVRCGASRNRSRETEQESALRRHSSSGCSSIGPRRSEERRVGKESRYRWVWYDKKEKMKCR